MAIVLAALVIALAFVASAVAMFARESVAKKNHALQLHSSRLRAGLQAHCERLALLRKDPFFTAPRSSADAGPFLNPMLPWSAEPQQPAPALALDASVLETFQKWGSEWPAHGDQINLSRFDTAWLHELRRFGYWAIEGDGRFNKPFNAKELACPDYMTLRTWARIHLLKGMSAGTANEAAADIQHFAWLTFTNETMVSAMCALALLNVEREAFQAAAKAGHSTEGWTPVSRKRSTRIFRALWAGLGLALPENDADLVAVSLSHEDPVPGQCVILTERAFHAAALRSIGDTSSWIDEFERSLSKYPGCRLGLAKGFLRNGSAPTDPAELGWKGQISWLGRIGGEVSRHLSPAFYLERARALVTAESLLSDRRYPDILQREPPVEEDEHATGAE